MIYYRDEIEKMKYLRGRIAGSLVMSGAYPDRNIIDKRLAAIDSKLALFQHMSAEESSKLNVKYFNESMMNIYQDLLILYNLVYEFSANKYETTKSYVEMHLAELENLADRYQRKSFFETGNTSVGKTIFFQSNGFNQTTRNYMTHLSLGKVSVAPGSKVSFFITGRYFKPEDVTFQLGKFVCSPFSINSDYIKIPGEIKYNSYNCDFPADIKHDKMFALNSDAFKPTQLNKYIIYGGQDNITVTNRTNRFVEKKKDTPLTLDDSIGRVTFYVLNGSYVNFEFSKPTLSQNFSGYMIQGLQSHHKITFEYEGPFSFNFKTDGLIYATRKNGIVKNEQLLYPDMDKLNKFRIEEYKDGHTESYSLSATIRQSSDYEPLVNMIAVKELSILDEVEYA